MYDLLFLQLEPNLLIVADFHRKLATWQFEQQREQIEIRSGIFCECKNKLRCLIGNDPKYEAIVLSLDGIYMQAWLQLG